MTSKIFTVRKLYLHTISTVKNNKQIENKGIKDPSPSNKSGYFITSKIFTVRKSVLSHYSCTHFLLYIIIRKLKIKGLKIHPINLDTKDPQIFFLKHNFISILQFKYSLFKHMFSLDGHGIH